MLGASTRMEKNLNTHLEDTSKGNHEMRASSCSLQLGNSLSCWLLEGEKMLRDKNGSTPSLVCLLLDVDIRCWAGSVLTDSPGRAATDG